MTHKNVCLFLSGHKKICRFYVANKVNSFSALIVIPVCILSFRPRGQPATNEEKQIMRNKINTLILLLSSQELALSMQIKAQIYSPC